MVDHRWVLIPTGNSSDSTPIQADVLKWPNAPLQDVFFWTFSLGGVRIDVVSDDETLFDDMAATFGRNAASSADAIGIRVTVRSKGDSGELTIDTDDASSLTPDDLILGLDSADFPFRQVEGEDPSWASFAFGDETEAIFSFRGNVCRFRKHDRWRPAIAFLLIHRIYRLRRDAIFFHASSVDIDGGGVMFIGRKGAGKSTTSLALAAAGFPLLGDEIACYVPASEKLQPFRRPVGIKPGPRATPIQDALLRIGCARMDEVQRIDFDRILDAPPPSEVPLRAIVFLEPFEAAPRIESFVASRADVAQLQPVVSSLVNAPRLQRVFEMARMLSSSNVYRFWPGPPDETAAFLIRTFGGSR
jgi:hypothetical protein